MSSFSRFIGIDYSGAETPDSSLRGLQIASVEHDHYVKLVPPPKGAKKYWTREGIAHWLVEVLSDGPATIVGIDHGFSFPLAYFEKHEIALKWPAFLDDFCATWPTDRPHTYVDFIRDDQRRGLLPERSGSTRWRRVTEICAGPAKSVFHFDVQGSVAKSTHAGLPWLRYVRQHVRRPVHFWPFDGWTIPAGHSAIVEVYPRLWRLAVPTPHGMTEHELDAHIIARTLCDADVDGRLTRWLGSEMSAKARGIAEVEGWILGVDATMADSALAKEGRRQKPRPRPRGRSKEAALNVVSLLTALDFAALKHSAQRRKDVQESPYLNHLVAVARVLASEGGVTDESLLLAAVLHDTVEDTDTTFEELEVQFGPGVAGIVREVTDDKGLDKSVRKERQVEHAIRASPRAKQLKIADKIANIRDIVSTPPADWSRERKVEYLAWAERVVAGCRGVNPALDAAFDALLVSARRFLAVEG